MAQLLRRCGFGVQTCAAAVKDWTGNHRIVRCRVLDHGVEIGDFIFAGIDTRTVCALSANPYIKPWVSLETSVARTVLWLVAISAGVLHDHIPFKGWNVEFRSFRIVQDVFTVDDGVADRDRDRI